MTIAIVVHGGAWEIPDRLVGAHESGCRAAVEIGHSRLRDGASALDAVEAAVRALEDDPTFDAGYGTFLNRDGVVELDAGIMNGATLGSGAVAAVRGVPHPVTLARRILERGAERLVVGAGAEAIAVELAVETVPIEALVSADKRAFWERHRHDDPTAIFAPRPRGTVGAVALDGRGDVAAATSTGGLPGKRAGRVGDSAIVGAGFFADSILGGASATGHGEPILTIGLARFVVERLRDGLDISTATREGIAALAAPRIEGRGGIVALDARGRAAAAFNTSRMARAWIDADGTGTWVDR